MDEAGYPGWDWSMSRQYATPIDPLAPGYWLAEPNRPFRSAQLMAQQPRLLAEEAMNADDVDPEEQAAVVACVQDTPPVAEAEADSVARPVIATRLAAAWHERVEEAAAQVGTPEAYLDCLEDADIPVLGSDLPVYRLPQAVSAMGPGVDEIPSTPSDAAATSSGWLKLLEAEAAVNAADWSCRSEEYFASIGDVAVLTSEFEEEFKREIADAQEGWHLIVKKAESLGYTGASGPLGR